MQITIATTIKAPLDAVWHAWNTPADILQWNTASDDWHTVRSEVDLREGGHFSSRMEAKDGSMGFDFAGSYTRIVPGQLIASDFGGRKLLVEFEDTPHGVTVRETFDAESSHPIEQQRAGWQSILDRFARHVEQQHKA
ncbi:SRPBCC domain-containing protein [Comamonas sp. GB3 AK4-5]|uniref:SRPBCC domain-containing protein n=1 Tax=Comamonas sp. GB3 AK4-5 TaxID=3231487 RepID=UPI00351E98D4